MYQLIVIILLLNYQHKYTVLANVSYGSSAKEWNLLTIIENNFNVGLSTTDSDFVLNLTAKDHDFYFPAQSIFPDMIIKEDVFFYLKFHPKSTSFTILTIRDAYNTVRLGIRVFEKRGQFTQYRLNVFYNPIPQGKINYQNETELTIPFSNSTWTLGVLLENRKITIYTKCEDIKRPFGYHQSKDTAPTNEKFFNGGATLFIFNNGDNAGHKEKFEGTVSDLLLTDKSQINELMCIEEIEGSGMTPKKWKPKNIGNYLITEESTTSTAKGLETTSSRLINADSTLSTLTKQRIVSKKRKSRKPRPIKRKSTTKTKKPKKKRYSQTKNQTTTTAAISKIKDISISKSSNDTVIPTTLDKKLISTSSESIIRTVNQIQTLSTTVSQSSSTTLTSNPTNVPTTFTTSNLTKTPNNPKTVATNPTTTKTSTLTTTPTNPTTTLTNPTTTPTNPTTTPTNPTKTPKNPRNPTTTTTPTLTTTPTTTTTTTKMTTLTTTPTSTQTTTPSTTTITTSTTQSTIPSTSQSPLWSTTSQTTLSTKIPTISTILNKNAKSVKSAYSTVSIFSLDNTKGEKGEKGEHGSPGQTSSECSCLEYLRLNIPGKGTTGPKGETGEKGEKGNPGIPGRNGICESNQCKFKIPSKGLKGDRGENGFCSAELCKRSVISSKGNKGDKGEIGSQGIKGERGNNLKISSILSIVLPEVKSTIDDFLNKNIMNLKGEPGSCLCKTNVMKEDDKIKTQSIVLNDAKKLKSLSFNMPVGQIVFLIVENILLVKIDELKNRWRPVKLENPESDWYFASDTQNYQSIPQTTVPISQIFNTAFKLMLIALPNPTGGDLRSDPLEPGAYSGSSYLCQKQAYNYGLGRAFYPLLNTDMFDFTYLLPEKYRYGVPVVNRRNEKIANSYVDLLKQTVEMQASILDFRGDSIMSDTNYPCIWIGVKPTLHEDKSPTEDGLCLNWMSKSPNDTALVTELKLDKPLLDPVQIKYKSCNNICYILCMQIYPLMSEVRKL